VIGYFRQEGLGDGVPFSFVDIGWVDVHNALLVNYWTLLVSIQIWRLWFLLCP
jgi:hypothetical protein